MNLRFFLTSAHCEIVFHFCCSSICPRMLKVLMQLVLQSIWSLYIYIVYGKPLFSSPAVLICQMIRTYQKLSQERGGEIENLTNFATLRTLHWMFSPAVITSAQQAINPFNSQRQQNNLQEKLN